MKIRIKTASGNSSINTVGNIIVSLKTGNGTRTTDKMYEVIQSPKGEHEPGRMWFVSDNGHPINVLIGKFGTFRRATEEEAKEFKQEQRVEGFFRGAVAQ